VFQLIAAQTDTVFWFVAPRAARDHSDRTIEFRISSASNNPAEVKVSQPANPNFATITRNIPAGQNVPIDLTPRITMVPNYPSNTVNKFGILIESTEPVTVYYELCGSKVAGFNDPNNPEIFSLKGKNALGTEFYIPGQTEFPNNGYAGPPPARNVFDIVATENGTSVTITPKQALEGGRQANQPFTVNLNRGETFSCAATGTTPALHLHGSFVTSNKPIAITVSDDSLSQGSAHDMIGDQLVPVPILGQEYIAIRGDKKKSPNNAKDYERVYILATQPNTKVMVSNKTMFWTNLAGGAAGTGGGTIATAGGFIVLKFDLADYLYIKSDKPVYAYHLTPFYNDSSFDSGEFGSALLPTINCTGSYKVVYTRGYNRNNSTQKLYLNICVPNEGIADFTLNGDANVIRAVDFLSVGDAPTATPPTNWRYARIEIPTSKVGFSGTMTIENKTTPFHAGIFDGSNAGASYGYYSDFGLSLEPEVATNVGDITCVGQTVNFFLLNESVLQNIEWIGPDGVTVVGTDPRLTINDVTSADAGTYTATADSRQGCEVKPAVYNLTVLEPKANVDLAHSLCGKPGSVEVTPSDGEPEYNIIWRLSNGASGIDNGEFESENLTIGTYEYTITDNKGCTFNSSFNIDPIGDYPPEPNFKDTVVCNGTQYTRSLDSNLSYEWQDGSTNNSYTFTSTGDYALTVTNPDGCTSSKKWHVEFATISTTTSFKDVTCSGEANGSVTTNPTGTSKSFTYRWQSGNTDVGTTQTIDNIPAGTYTVTITDEFGCTTSATQTISSPEAMNVKSNNIELVNCYGQNTGKVEISADGGVEPYTILWSSPNLLGFSPSNLTAGEHTYTITDGNSCKSVNKITIDQAPEITIDPRASVALCYGEKLEVTILAVGGTNPLSIKWQDGTTSFTHKNIPANTKFNFTITDKNNCFKESFVDIDSPLPLEIVPKIYDVRCKGGNDGYISINITGGTEPYSTRWSNTGTSSNSIEHLSPGEYSVTVVDANKCSFTRSFTVEEPSRELELNLTKKDNICYGAEDGNLFLKAEGGVSPYSYHLYNNHFEAWGDNITQIPAGDYDLAVTDYNNCRYLTTVKFVQPTKMEARITPTDPDCNGNTNGQIKVEVIGGIAPYTYTLMNELSEEGIFSNLSAGTYFVEVFDNNNCPLRLEPVMLADPEIDCIEIPNTFTPNGDNQNDIWVIKYIELFPDAIIEVYNQWGQLLFNSKTAGTMYWDGKFNGNNVPTGSYIYVIDLFDINKTKYSGVVYVTY
jgi:gliding motility-associated-like protein